ncbi:hypothetical protein [Actinomadura rayongensis]|uniref:Uncharacterized protein n=1 Tax=Actinomadura rayongensis TaxID=1429076 RepID=A0A6I4WIC2_9ACTN|nr:hypothetical protein [Actinomadura rayongensis]MXQ66744.1 hypothetical protein [Actinomadura rayongensis]
MLRINAEVSVTFTHILRRIYAPGYAYTRYQSHKLQFSRPASGKIKRPIVCPACGRTLTCTIRDATETLRIRLTFGLIAVVALVGLVLAFTVGMSWATKQDGPAMAFALIAGCLVLFFTLFRAGLWAFFYPGVDLKYPLLFLPKRHEIGGG